MPPRRAAQVCRPYRGLRIGGTARPGGRALHKKRSIIVPHPPPSEAPSPKGKVFGRLIAAPTKYGKLSGLSVGADDLGGPRAHPVRPYSGERGGRLDLANSGAVIELR